MRAARSLKILLFAVDGVRGERLFLPLPARRGYVSTKEKRKSKNKRKGLLSRSRRQTGEEDHLIS